MIKIDIEKYLRRGPITTIKLISKLRSRTQYASIPNSHLVHMLVRNIKKINPIIERFDDQTTLLKFRD